MSQGRARSFILRDASSLLTFASEFSSRAVRIRWQDSAARARARARPMPRVAPVIRATWPRRRADFWILFEVREVKETRRDILSQHEKPVDEFCQDRRSKSPRLAEDARHGAPGFPELLYTPFGRWRIRERNSERVSSSWRKQPSIDEVTAAECCFSTPRIIMQR